MRLLVLDVEAKRSLFVLSASKRSWQDEDPARGRWERFKAKTARAYDRLRDRLDYYEKICGELKGIKALTLVYAEDCDPATAIARAEAFFEGRRRRHTAWFTVDLVLAALGGLLMPLPGPNLFFFYPAARAFGHHQARTGASDALGCRPWELMSDSKVSSLRKWLFEGMTESEDLKGLERAYNFEDLGKRLRSLRKI